MKMTYEGWQASMGYVSDEEYRKRMYEDSFTRSHVEFRIKEMHEWYKEEMKK
jgi:hypothetical protein